MVMQKNRKYGDDAARKLVLRMLEALVRPSQVDAMLTFAVDVDVQRRHPTSTSTSTRTYVESKIDFCCNPQKIVAYV